MGKNIVAAIRTLLMVGICIACLNIPSHLQSQSLQGMFDEYDCASFIKRKQRFQGRAAITDFFAEIARDVVEINYNLISFDSFAIIAALFPPFIAARMIDEPLQNCFYRRCCHKNVHQLPSWCRTTADYFIGIPAVYFGLQGLFSCDDELRTMGQLLLVGLPFIIFGKDLLKHCKFHCGLRPWNEYFSHCKRARNGFPSGHVAEATYVAALYGLRFGPKYAIPLGAGALFVAVSFVNCNRHYLSQMVAGAGLGLIYAVAANKVVDARLDEYGHWRCGLDMDCRGKPVFSLSCQF